VKVVTSKAGSYAAHHNEYALIADLLPDEALRYIVENDPLIFVVDGSNSNSRPERSVRIIRIPGSCTAIISWRCILS